MALDEASKRLRAGSVLHRCLINRQTIAFSNEANLFEPLATGTSRVRSGRCTDVQSVLDCTQLSSDKAASKPSLYLSESTHELKIVHEDTPPERRQPACTSHADALWVCYNVFIPSWEDLGGASMI